MNEICGDNRFEIIAKAKEHLLEATNIADSEDEMKVLDSFLFSCWQMGWLDRYDDRKTENCSEKPNNCETCKQWWKSEEVCLLDDCQYEPKTEPTADNLSAFDKDTNVRSKDCETCKYKDHNWWSNKCDPCCRGNSNYESIKAFQDLYGIKAEPPTLKEMVEPQTERRQASDEDH